MLYIRKCLYNDTAYKPGYIQPVANDGINSGNSLFTGLIVPGKAPRIVISIPPTGQTITTTKSAFVQDIEDDLIDADYIVWTSD